MQTTHRKGDLGSTGTLSVAAPTRVSAAAIKTCQASRSSILHNFRFAACQFAQKSEGIPLNYLVLSVANYFARLSHPVHIATWVDDLYFSMRFPNHPAWLPGRGPLAGKGEGTQSAVGPLSYGKGHTVAQGDLFTLLDRATHVQVKRTGVSNSVALVRSWTGQPMSKSVLLDTLHGTYTMLTDKLKSRWENLRNAGHNGLRDLSPPVQRALQGRSLLLLKPLSRCYVTLTHSGYASDPQGRQLPPSSSGLRAGSSLGGWECGIYCDAARDYDGVGRHWREGGLGKLGD